MEPDTTVIELEAEPEDETEDETEEGSADPLAPLSLLSDALAGIGRALAKGVTDTASEEAEDTDEDP